MPIMTEKKYMEEPKKKNPFQKLKESINDKEEQLAFISVVVRLVVVAWSGFIVSLNYVNLPGYSNEPKDITFPASLLTGALASFGLEGAKKRKENGDEKKELAKTDGSYQTIRVETPIKIVGAKVVDPKK